MSGAASSTTLSQSPCWYASKPLRTVSTFWRDMAAKYSPLQRAPPSTRWDAPVLDVVVVRTRRSLLLSFEAVAGLEAGNRPIDRSRRLRPARRLRDGEGRRRETPGPPVRPRKPVPLRALRECSPT